MEMYQPAAALTQLLFASTAVRKGAMSLGKSDPNLDHDR
jgi:hypothetical protein